MNKSQDDANGDTEMNSYTSPRGNRMFALLCFLLLAVPGFTQEREPPTVGLALAGGGALGFAHLGVILELDALGVPIHYVAGTSMGSIIGALYATGYDGEEILEIVAGTNWNELFRDTPPRRGLPYQERRAGKRYLAEVGLREGELALRSGVSAGQNVVELLDRLMRRYGVSGSFDRFPRPLRVVATDLVTGEEIVFAEGDLKSTIRASMAVPGVFTPVEYRERLLIDGGWSNVLPVDAVRKMGADEVIAVKLGGVTSEPEQLDSMRKIVNQAAAILRQPRQEANLADADLVVEPDVSLFSVVSFDDALALVEAGRRAAREVQAELVALADRATAGAEESPQPLENPLLPPSRDRLLTISRIGYSHARPTPETRRLLEQELLGESWVSEVQEQVEALYDSGGYVYASYQLEPEEDEVALILQLQMAEETRTTVRGGYTFRSEPLTTIDPTFVLRSNLTVRGVTGVGSRWSTDLLLSEVPSIRTEYDHPLTGPLFLVSTLYARGEPFRYYRERKVESSYTRRYYGGSLGVRTVLFEAVQLTAEGVGEWVSTSLQGGVDRELESGAGQLGLSVTAVADNFDRYPFPRRGTESVIDYRYRVQPATGIAHNSLEAEQRYFFPILRASAAGMGYRLFSDLDSGAPPYERSFLGGFGSFSGLHDQELTGRHSATLSGELRFNLFSLPLGAGDRVYLSLRGNVGNVWEEELSTIWREPELISGGSVGLAADTVFGQLHLHFSVAAGEALGENQVRYSTYLLLGNKVDGTLSAAYR